MNMKTIGDLLKVKGGQVWSVPSNATVFDALKIMSERNIGALVVFDPSGSLVGIISERDYARKVILVGKSSLSTPVIEIMTAVDRIVSAEAGSTLEDCLVLFSEHHIRHLPVLKDSTLIGMISSRDVIRALIEDQDGQIEKLYDRLDEIR